MDGRLSLSCTSVASVYLPRVIIFSLLLDTFKTAPSGTLEVRHTSRSARGIATSCAIPLSISYSSCSVDRLTLVLTVFRALYYTWGLVKATRDNIVSHSTHMTGMPRFPLFPLFYTELSLRGRTLSHLILHILKEPTLELMIRFGSVHLLRVIIIRSVPLMLPLPISNSSPSTNFLRILILLMRYALHYNFTSNLV